MHTMYYPDEIRQVDEFRTDKSLVQEKELKLALTLVESLAADFEPEKYKDGYRENLKALIAAKVEGREMVQTPQAPKLAPVVDIMDALKKSLAEIKKPVRSAPAAASAAPAKAKAKTSRR
jgi:DNA end-binding protein Ku